MEEPGDTSHVPNRGLAKQILSSILVAVMTLHAGMVQGWQSPMSLKLKQDDSPVEKLDKDQLANFATIPSYVGLGGAFVISFLAHKFGRKVAIYFIGVISAIGGAFLTFAPTTLYLYIGRSCSSMAVGGISLAPMFISEIVHGSIRGTLLAMCTFQLNLGIVVSYTAGAKLSYKVFNIIFVIVPIVYTILIFVMPETPLFLAEKSRLEDAKKSMVWYRGGDHRVAELELDRITASKKENSEKLSFGEILKSKVTRLAFIISVLGYVFQTLSGIHAILNYAGIIFEESGSVMSPEDSSIIIALILLASSVFNVFLMDRLGRKPLLYVSCIGAAAGMLVIAIFLYVRMKGAEVEHLGWIPISSLGLFIFTYGIGLAAVPGAVLNEISPTSIKPAVGAGVMICVFVLLMATVQTFPYMDEHLGLYSVFIIPVVANVVGVFFTMFMVPETKGKSLAEIEEELKNR